MRRTIVSLGLLVTVSWMILEGQLSPVEKGLNAINTDVLKAQLGFLASDWTEGREAGQRGEYMAGDYIASMLQLYGVKPGGDYPYMRGFTNIQKGRERTFFQNFILLKRSQGDEEVLKIRTSEGPGMELTSLTYNVDYIIHNQGSGAELDAPVVFVGYGFKNDKLKYNDFSKLDLRGKFALKISGSPGFARESLSPSELSESSRQSETLALSMGALGMIEISPYSATVGTTPGALSINMSPSEGNPRAGRPFARYSIPGTESDDNLLRVIISSVAAKKMLDGTGIVLEDFIKKAETDRNISLPVITGKSVYLKTTIKTEAIRVRNIIGIIEGENPDQVIVLGAHYDHIGAGNGYIWNGADDNASGTVGVMTVAKAFAESGQKPEKTIILALWTAEEEGLLGSQYYVSNLPFSEKNIRLNVNYDMISRYISDDDPNKVIMTYTESCPEFRKITEENIKKYGIELIVDFQPSDDPPGGSDHRTFAAAGIPIMRFKPGHREEYHTPADQVNTVDWDIMEKIVRISFANIWELANSDW